MKALVTGSNGTVGRALATCLEQRHDHWHGWSREAAPPCDEAAQAALLDEIRPDVVFHLAIASRPTGVADEGERVNVAWPALLARDCRTRGIRLVFTSTAMVFTPRLPGPYTPQHVPDETAGYGGQKRRAELAVQAADPQAVIVRLGWQIGRAPGSNNMVDHLARQADEQGVIRASRRWLPACSLLPDTANALIEATNLPGGIYQLDANARWSFHDIAQALNVRDQRGWRMLATDDFVYDQRMLDPRIAVTPLEQGLPLTAARA